VDAWRKFLLHLAWGGLLAASLPGVVLPTAAQQSTVSENGSGRPVGSDHTVREPSSAVNSGKQMQELPDSPGIVLSKLNSPFQAQSSNEQQSAVTSSSVASQRSQPAQSPMVEQAIPQAPQKPVGTATAGTPRCEWHCSVATGWCCHGTGQTTQSTNHRAPNWRDHRSRSRRGCCRSAD
jgi:hypothetical protein